MATDPKGVVARTVWYDTQMVVEFDYTNHKGEFGVRRVVPIRVYFGATEYHRDEQWLVEAYDIDRRDMRTFALKDIKNWRLPTDRRKSP